MSDENSLINPEGTYAIEGRELIRLRAMEAKPSDVEVQKVIDEFEGHDWSYEIRDEYNNYHGHNYWLDDKSYNTILAALRQYTPTEPCEECVDGEYFMLDVGLANFCPFCGRALHESEGK